MCYVGNQLRKAMVRPTKLYWNLTKHVLWYLRGTTQFGLWYRQTKGVKLCGFIHVDWARSSTNRKSTLSGIFSVGSPTVSWYKRKQRFVALNSVEVEYMAASKETCEVLWMREILVALFSKDMDLIVIYCDNNSCIKLFDNLVFHDMSKHNDIRYHHLRDCVQGRIIPTKEHDEDILTKALSRGKLEFHRFKIGVVKNPFLAKREC